MALEAASPKLGSHILWALVRTLPIFHHGVMVGVYGKGREITAGQPEAEGFGGQDYPFYSNPHLNPREPR